MAPGDWFARTECFGPVLGLMAARDLEEALALQNTLPYGLTGGIWSLDPGDCERWADRVEVGNAYVNRPITGAIVGRQPFGGWKRSVVGPGAKAGGPNYVLQLCRVEDTARPDRSTEPSPVVRALMAGLAGGLTGADHARARGGGRQRQLLVDHQFRARPRSDRALLRVQRPALPPFPGLTVRVAPDTAPFDVARVLVAVAGIGAAAVVSLHPDAAGAVEPATVRLLPRSTTVVETAADLAARVAGLPSAHVPASSAPSPSWAGSSRPSTSTPGLRSFSGGWSCCVTCASRRCRTRCTASATWCGPSTTPFRSRGCRPTSHWATTPGGRALP